MHLSQNQSEQFDYMLNYVFTWLKIIIIKKNLLEF